MTTRPAPPSKWAAGSCAFRKRIPPKSHGSLRHLLGYRRSRPGDRSDRDSKTKLSPGCSSPDTNLSPSPSVAEAKAEERAPQLVTCPYRFDGERGKHQLRQTSAPCTPQLPPPTQPRRGRRQTQQQQRGRRLPSRRRRTQDADAATRGHLKLRRGLQACMALLEGAA